MKTRHHFHYIELSILRDGLSSFISETKVKGKVLEYNTSWVMWKTYLKTCMDL